MTQPGYEIDRDGRGLTKRERQVVGLLIVGERPIDVAGTLGLTKQRVAQIVRSLEKKGLTEDSIEVLRSFVGVAPNS